MSKPHSSHDHGHCDGTLSSELVSHFPYAVFSVALSFIGAGLMTFFSFGADAATLTKGSMVLFHTFHFMHIVFAATGAMITFFRFSNNLIRGIIVGTLSTVFFCILSDIIFPYLAGMLLGVDMDLHICFASELHNVIPFLIIGILNGWMLNKHKGASQSSYSVWSHFAHIFVSSVASLLYMIAHGFDNWPHYMGPIFVLLVLAVVVPCTLSDVVIPMFFAHKD